MLEALVYNRHSKKKKKNLLRVRESRQPFYTSLFYRFALVTFLTNNSSGNSKALAVVVFGSKQQKVKTCELILLLLYHHSSSVWE